METSAIAADLVKLCSAGQFLEAIETHYGEDIVSTEPFGETPVVKGKDAVRAKSHHFMETITVHSLKVEGPWVLGDQFGVRFTLDAETKHDNKRMTMDEIGIYTVSNGKIVDEKFFYAS